MADAEPADLESRPADEPIEPSQPTMPAEDIAPVIEDVPETEDAAAEEKQVDRESSSSSTKSTKRKRSTSNTSTAGAAPPPAKVPRRTKRVVAAPPAPVPTSSRERSKSGGSSRKPAAPKRPARKGSRLVEEVVDDEPSEEYEGKTRCICGITDDDDSYGFMIMCEQCKCWQHGACVGIPSEAKCPDIYYCEQCRPDLHPDLQRDSPEGSSSNGGRRSRVRESADAAMVSAFLSKDEAEDSQPAAPAAATSPGPPMYPPTSHFAEPKHPGRRRSTMNSRDAAYEESLAAALALSQAELGNGIARPGSGQAARRSRSETQEPEVTPAPSQRRRPGQKRKHSTTEGEAEPISKRINGLAREETRSRSGSPQDSDRALASIARPQRNGKRNAPSVPPPAADESDSQSGSQPPVVRAKHPNQYTYRPKASGDEKPPTRPSKVSPSKRKQVAIRDAAGRDSDGDFNGSLAPPPMANGKTKRKKGSSAAAAAAAAVAAAVAKDELERRNGSSSTPPERVRSTANAWHLPAHLEHLAPTLGEAPSQPLSTKPKYPTKRASMVDMRKRAKTMLDYLARTQILLSAPSPASASTSGESSNGIMAPTTADLIADLETEVRAFSERYANAPSAPARSGLSQSVVA